MSEIIDDDIFNPNEDPAPTTENYNDDSIVHLEDMEHIRRRPGMYIGKLGDGASQLTLRFMKVAITLTFTALLVLCMLPTSFFEWIFTGEFSDIHSIILLTAPGIMLYSAHTILANYFSGTGQPKINLYASLIGLSVTIVAAFILIPWWGIRGAAITASLTYTALFIYHWIVFHKKTGCSITQLIPNRQDWEWVKATIHELF